MKNNYKFQKLKQSKSSIRNLRFLMVLLLGLLLLPAQRMVAQTIEDGTAEHPFLIESAEEFNDFHTCMIPGSVFYHDGHTFKTTCTGDSCKTIPAGGQGIYFKLTTDIVINSGNVSGCDGVPEDGWINWEPMQSFNGHFDGNYHAISGIYSNHPNSSQTGFFYSYKRCHGSSGELGCGELLHQS